MGIVIRCRRASIWCRSGYLWLRVNGRLWSRRRNSAIGLTIRRMHGCWEIMLKLRSRVVIHLSGLSLLRTSAFNATIQPFKLEPSIFCYEKDMLNTYQQMMRRKINPKKMRMPVRIQRPTRWKKDSGLQWRTPLLS
jgi:hypothetical protein